MACRIADEHPAQAGETRHAPPRLAQVSMFEATVGEGGSEPPTQHLRPAGRKMFDKSNSLARSERSTARSH
jgi:hypothetical protein